MKEIVTPFADAEVVHGQAEARRLLQENRERQWPGCWVPSDPVPGESSLCHSPRELIRAAFGRLTPETPRK